MVGIQNSKGPQHWICAEGLDFNGLGSCDRQSIRGGYDASYANQRREGLPKALVVDLEDAAQRLSGHRFTSVCECGHDPILKGRYRSAFRRAWRVSDT